MKLYTEEDVARSRSDVKSGLMRMLLFALPFFAVAAAGFVVRNQVLCTAGAILAGASMILTYDIRVMPARRYRNHLAEIHAGLTRQTVGTLVRVGADPVHDIGLNFTEIILNIYEDMDVEGERRFLLDVKKPPVDEWLGQDVVVTHHGSYVLEICPVEEMREK